MNRIRDLKNSELGSYPMVGHPVGYSKNLVKPGKGAPTLGGDSVNILEEFGFNQAEIDEFKKQAVIKQA